MERHEGEVEQQGKKPTRVSIDMAVTCSTVLATPKCLRQVVGASSYSRRINSKLVIGVGQS